MVKPNIGIKKINIHHLKFIVECKPKFIGVPIAFIYWLFKCKKVFRYGDKQKLWMIVIPKFESGVV